MPELPEVETVRKGLSELLVGRRVKEVTVFNARLRFPVPSDFATRLRGAQVLAIDRRAKYLLIRSDHGVVLSHLGMTGTWQRVGRRHEPRTHDHLRLVRDDDVALIYRDPRKFGFVDFVNDEATHPRLKDLGPEPLDVARFDAAYLAAVLAGRSAPIKSLLMDQGVVVGVGNIYAAEALFRAGIHPLAKARRVREERLQRLIIAVREVLAEAIVAGGSTVDDFRKINGQSGYFQHSFAVYGRQGEPCQRCGRTLKLALIGGRSSVYCPHCQRA